MDPTPETHRLSGILLHPTSLPGPGGIGSLGREAVHFLEQLAAAGQQLWQLLPLVPVGPGASPYSGLSAFAGEPLLIDLPDLVDRGWLDAADLGLAPDLPKGTVDFTGVRRYKLPLLRKAWRAFERKASPTDQKALKTFQQRQSYWLQDYCLFVALKEKFDGQNWTKWPKELVIRDSCALADYEDLLAAEIRYHQFCQYVFELQWQQIRRTATARGIQVLGDLPIFVAFDSADVWAQRDFFHVDETGRAADVAGVPPDYFSEEGQLWGNPLYRWDNLAAQGYSWWVERFRRSLELYDVIRLDHFRGFAAYWAVPAAEKTAKNGRWVTGPGINFFKAVEASLGRKLPVIAEDLGVITPDVVALRETMGYPGMKVLQFAFDSPNNAYLPHNYTRDCIAYTGTHDNDTTRGWWLGLGDTERRAVQSYLARDGHDISWDLIRTAWSSVADLAVVPLQDVLDLDSRARMNTPGEADGNWSWRLLPGQLTDFHLHRLRSLTRLYGRLAAKPGEPPQTLV